MHLTVRFTAVHVQLEAQLQKHEPSPASLINWFSNYLLSFYSYNSSHAVNIFLS